MDADRFDALSRILSTGCPRRHVTRLLGGLGVGGVLRLLTGGTLGAVVFQLGHGETAAACAVTSCLRTADCDACAGTICRNGKCCRAEGRGCTRDGQCCSGRCRNGTCRCVAAKCRQALPDEPCKRAQCVSGRCDFAPAPTTTMCRPAAGTCDAAEFCDGASLDCPNDKLAAAGTVCEARKCTDETTLQPARTCDGNGTCSSPTTKDCRPYFCSSELGLCLGSCGGPSSCVSTHYCKIGVGRCEPKLDNGQSCNSFNDECKSGICAPEGVCCDQECRLECHSCLEAKTGSADGTCAPVMDGLEDQDSCNGVCRNGECQPT
jgi:hypothetical protein